jgi:hypothetical protein
VIKIDKQDEVTMLITETKLRRVIRKNLLSEAMMTPERAERRGIRLQVRNYSDLVTITAISGEDEDDVVGVLWAEKLPENCLKAWEIRKSKVSSEFDGLGPLLYDLMIDLVSPDPLTPDRGSVSLAAKNVWDYYMNNRPDIVSSELDNQYDERTRGYKADNCEYTSALMWSRKELPWYETSIARAYKRAAGGTPMLDALDNLGIIEFVS